MFFKQNARENNIKLLILVILGNLCLIQVIFKSYKMLVLRQYIIGNAIASVCLCVSGILR